MRWLIFTPDDDLLAKQCESFLQVAGQTVVQQSTSKSWSLQQIKDQIHHDKPDRIVIVVDQQKENPLVQTLTHQLLLPMFVVQATNLSFGSTPVLILNIVHDDENLRYINEATDQLTSMFSHVIK